MTTYPFTRSTGKFPSFVEKLCSVGTPSKVDHKFVASMGFKSSHDRAFPSVLKKAGLLDNSGVPTDAYKKGLRGGEAGKSIVAEAIRNGYAELFEVYPDANSASDDDIASFIRVHSDLDETGVSLAVKTFKILCQFGDFSSIVSSNPDGGSTNAQTDKAQAAASKPQAQPSAVQTTPAAHQNVTINVNIELSVEATKDAEVYDAFFSAMARHLKDLGGSSE
ncbi:DUF5343 domain-containing protein [Allobranchiibius sp. GilTou73]|uniref:DUF5343 domain-containing protein n=1 Tax=Allobranchiibius sp. GilTou73 TaxID=2904523 RepID=UPI001F1DD6F0|nr:DUF5343 domain-containing protein [Allobranchiibius sp. GilTou73]UIJ33620.1 DUF5343 domain-containing protein [Allobranchiibius sp. GilTou73]